MLLTERELRNIIKEAILTELFTPGMDSYRGAAGTRKSFENLLSDFDPMEEIAEKWDDISDGLIDAIMESHINSDLNAFYEGAIEGDADKDDGLDNLPGDNLRHGVMFQDNLDYLLGYKWGYENGATWDGKEIPADVRDYFIEVQIQEYKERTKTEITKDVLFTAYDNVSPNRILRKAYYPIKDAYNEGGFGNAVKKGVPLAMAIAIVETLDQVVIPLICIKFGLPPLTNAVGLGELVYPVLLPKLGGKEEIDFIEAYRERSGNTNFHDDI